MERMAAKLMGHAETIGQRMERGPGALLPLPLPGTPYDACERQAGRMSSLSLVRYRTNDCSVPVAYGHRDMLVSPDPPKAWSHLVREGMRGKGK